MSVIYSSSFESPEALASIFGTQVGSTAAFDVGHIYSGARAIKVHQIGSASGSIRPLPANPGRVFCFRFGIYPVATPAANEQIAQITAGVNFIVKHLATGVLSVNWTGGSATAFGAMPLNQYNLIDLLIDTSGTTYTANWRVNGVAQPVSSSPVQAAGSDQTAFVIANGGANTIDYWYDVLAIGNTAGDYPLSDPVIPPPQPSKSGSRILLDLLT